MMRAIGLIAALLVSSSVVADESTYMIQCRILEAGRILGAPTVLAKSGNEVSVSVSDTYDLSIIAEGQGGDQVQLSTRISINGESHSPVILVHLNRAAEIQIGTTTLSLTVSSYVPDDAWQVDADGPMQD